MTNETADRAPYDELLAEAGKPLTAMTLERYEELKQQDMSNQPLGVNPEELLEYREFDEAMDQSRRLWESIDAMASGQRQGVLHSRVDELKLALGSSPAHRSEAHLQELVNEMRDAKAYELKNMEHLAVMAGALQEIRAARQQSELQQAKQDRFNKRMTWVAALLALGSIAAGVVMPFVEHGLWPSN